MLGRVAVPVIFILLLPIAFAASVKNDDKADNSLTFAFDAQTDRLDWVASSVRQRQGDDVFFTVSIAERRGNSPLVGHVRFGLLAKEAIRYRGTLRFQVVENGSRRAAYVDDKRVRFTLRPKKGNRNHRVRFPFDLAESGDFYVRVSFRR